MGAFLVSSKCPKIKGKNYYNFIDFSDKNEIIYNKQCGHMLRTKLEKSNEGGVAAGSGALDSPYLYDD